MHGHYEVRAKALRRLVEVAEAHAVDSAAWTATLEERIQSEQDERCLAHLATLLHRAPLHALTALPTLRRAALLALVLSHARDGNLLALRAHALVAAARLVRASLAEPSRGEQSEDAMVRWLALAYAWSEPTQPLQLRAAVAQAIGAAELALTPWRTQLRPLVLLIVRLLCDADDGVRTDTCTATALWLTGSGRALSAAGTLAALWAHAHLQLGAEALAAATLDSYAAVTVDMTSEDESPQQQQEQQQERQEQGDGGADDEAAMFAKDDAGAGTEPLLVLQCALPYLRPDALLRALRSDLCPVRLSSCFLFRASPSLTHHPQIAANTFASRFLVTVLSPASLDSGDSPAFADWPGALLQWLERTPRDEQLFLVPPWLFGSSERRSSFSVSDTFSR